MALQWTASAQSVPYGAALPSSRPAKTRSRTFTSSPTATTQSSGRFSGAQIQIVTKNGTNQVHGSLFFKADRPGLNAYQRWNGPGSEVPGTPDARGLQRNTSRFNQFGGSVGGPLWKDKLFAFFNYETIRNNSTATVTNWYEAPQFLKEAPSGSIANTLLTFPGEGAHYSSIISQSCASAGLVEGVDCHSLGLKDWTLALR